MPMLYSEAFNNKSIIPLKDDESSGLKSEAPIHSHIPIQNSFQTSSQKSFQNSTSYEDLLKQYNDLQNKINTMKSTPKVEEFKNIENKYTTNNNELLLIGFGGLLTLLLIEMVYHL